MEEQVGGFLIGDRAGEILDPVAPIFEAALALAVACGAANTQRFGAGVFDPADVESLMRRVEIVSED